jgi:phosphoglycolate phosphatase-like HAD superfamily hydrolase
VKLVLFDLDGTVLWTDGAGRRAMTAALLEVFGGHGPQSYHYDGKTDRQIVRDLMRLEGHGDAHIDERLPTLIDRYLANLEHELRDPAHERRLLPGVAELLDALEQRDDVILGLLTGNVAPGAAAKLRAVGIDPARFKVGAFGSDHEMRPELPAIAQRRAREILGLEIPAEEMFVIGDTPADIHCGREAGAITIGVATGRYTVAELRAHGATAVFEDLRDTGAILRMILHEASTASTPDA